MGKGSKNSESSLLVEDQDKDRSAAREMIENNSNKGQYTWEEVRRHSSKTDRWLVVDKRVFDVTRWTKHPGGQVILNHYAGQDATVGK